jgi:hypothetical protein
VEQRVAAEEHDDEALAGLGELLPGNLHASRRSASKHQQQAHADLRRNELLCSASEAAGSKSALVNAPRSQDYRLRSRNSQETGRCESFAGNGGANRQISR